MTASIKLMTGTMDESWFWKIGEEQSEAVSENDGNLQRELSKCEHFYQVFPAPPQLCAS